MGLHLSDKKHLSISALLSKVKDCFKKVTEPERKKQGKSSKISIVDCLMSGLALFGLKFPSLLQFDERRKSDKFVIHNLKTLYGVDLAPSDTYFRERLDEVNPREIRPAFNAVFSALQRGKFLEAYQYLNGYHLIMLDGTGHFSSSEVHCENCCVKEHSNGTKTYYHQMLGAAIAHPDRKEVIPLCPEPILKQDGKTKNDCERNATHRLLSDFRREHPHLKAIIVEDALSSNGPHIKFLKSHDLHFIIGVKPDGNKSLFEWVGKLSDKDYEEVQFQDKQGIQHRIRFINKVPLNDAHPDLEVNFLEYWETDLKGNISHFTWITDISITKLNAHALLRGGRARWKIENETFNTLKNQGYHFEHNFGHGNNHLCTTLGLLMFLTFLIDQAHQLTSSLFQAALEKMRSKTVLWEQQRVLFFGYYINDWSDLYNSIAHGHKGAVLTPDSS